VVVPVPEYLTYDRTVELLRRVVAEKGSDYVCPTVDDGDDEACRYVVDDQPSCLVAHVFVAAGVTVDELREVEGHGPTSVLERPQFLAWADQPARLLLARAQNGQDERHPWGEVVTFVIEGGRHE
jgi:hypothetical protein